MSKQIIICVVIFVMFSISDAVVKKHCNKEEDLLQRCHVSLPVLSSPEITFPIIREELDKSCVDLRAGIQCIDNYTETCMDKSQQRIFKQIYAGISDVIHDLCTRGEYQDKYLIHAECVKNVRTEYETCSKNYEVTLTGLGSQQQNEQYQTRNQVEREVSNTVCCSFQEYLKCSETTVQRSCGDEAALFTSAFLKRMASNIIKTFCHEYRGLECSYHSKAPRSNPALSISGVLVLATYIYRNLVPT